ncbi:hypothetical protein FRC20_010495 [Serendipita sp. 405]|nr:hypothetical protein FRC15_008718 [Serendipita sp. 397]KAG8803021.1 hypothetical protein FRC16_007702 [Serendipita sp. 398]KAG8836818.1 hypothetical protein FRC18_010624 [Serendipita sp. 400]KAG8871505.1 hypothetical protein FRC20_010495 [Serendipita sp. 405]
MPPKQRRTAQRQSQLQSLGVKQFEYLPSISRSGGGDDLDGDSLKKHDIQEKFRRWIDEKLLKLEASATEELGIEKEKLLKEDVLRLFRKLREGIIAAKRQDAFAAEVYELSLLLAAAYGATDQVTALAAQILAPSDTENATSEALGSILMKKEIVVLLALLHQIVLGLRHSPTFHSAVNKILQHLPTSLSPSRVNWLRGVMIGVKTQNYYAIWQLTSKASLTGLLQDTLSPGTHGKRQEAAITHEVVALHHFVRDTAWGVVRCAYRDEREDWLAITLHLSSNPGGWLLQKQQLQEALRSDNKQVRWKVYKPRI